MVKGRWWIVGLFGVSWAFVRLITNDPSHPPAPVQTPSPPTKLAPQTVPPQALPKAEAPTSELGATETARTLYVSGHQVALRNSPSKNGSIIDRLDFGRKVTFLGQENGWSHVRDDLTQRNGWVSSRLLSDEQPKEKQEPDKSEPKKVEPPKLPTLSDATIVARIIAESINGYPGNCPCPYNRDRAGHKCGRRSAYSKPGGYSPICFPADVTKAMVQAFRDNL